MSNVQTKRFSLLSVSLICLLSIFVGLSVGKYSISKEQTNNLDSAEWVINISNINTDNSNYTTSTLTTGKSAPGTEGTFTIGLDATGTETGVKYDISFSDVQDKPTNMYFMIGQDKYNSLDELAEVLSGTINAEDANKKVSKVVTWKWDYETTGNGKTVAENDLVDNADSGKTLTFKVNVVATQIRPAN